MQSSNQIITTNKPTSGFFTGRMPFLSPNQQHQSIEGKISHSMDMLTPSSPGGLPTLSLITNSSWLPWGRVAMTLISPFMPVPQHIGGGNLSRALHIIREPAVTTTSSVISCCSLWFNILVPAYPGCLGNRSVTSGALLL